MLPITFNVGPSRLSSDVRNDVCEAMNLGIVEMSHRSAQFSAMSGSAIEGLRTFFDIPDDYRVFFTSSATEAMEFIIRNLVQEYSFHFICGKFSGLFAHVSEANHKVADRADVPWGTSPAYDPASVPQRAELISITANETSTGVMCTEEEISGIRAAHPDKLLAVDITSIAGMKAYNIADADLWFFSVQKGFGLPSGLGVLMVSPRAFARSIALQDSGKNLAGLFTFHGMDQYMHEKAQTVCTPNVLDIFLLERQLKRWNAQGGITEKERQSHQKAALLYGAIERSTAFRCFVADSIHRSLSVAVLAGESKDIARFHALAKEEGLLLGNGYGKLKESTIRIALFPAITVADLERLISVMERVGDI
ncbi:MAG: aminotransferase class V-fold PLP-dependent enzyme [Candidatus Peribacteraceae bacterium]